MMIEQLEQMIQTVEFALAVWKRAADRADVGSEVEWTCLQLWEKLSLLKISLCVALRRATSVEEYL